MPNNNNFWIFPNANAVSATFSSNNRVYNHVVYRDSIHNLFTASIASVGPRPASATVHEPHYYTDDANVHALDTVLTAAEHNMETITRTRTPLQGRGTTLSIGGIRVYHETATYNRQSFDGICTLFYTFNPANNQVAVHAVGAHNSRSGGYCLDCASVDFDAAASAPALSGRSWGYISRGIVRL